MKVLAALQLAWHLWRLCSKGIMAAEISYMAGGGCCRCLININVWPNIALLERVAVSPFYGAERLGRWRWCLGRCWLELFIERCASRR